MLERVKRAGADVAIDDAERSEIRDSGQLPRFGSQCGYLKGSGHTHVLPITAPAMSEPERKLDGPDFAQGIALGDLAEGSMIAGQVAGEAVLLARTDDESRREPLGRNSQKQGQISAFLLLKICYPGVRCR